MKSGLQSILASSILRKQIVAATGVILVLYIFGHLAGNMLFFLGPEAFNGYAEKLHDLGPLLWVARVILLAALGLHVGYTIMLTLENWRARGRSYAVTNTKGEPGIAQRTMIYTGLLVFLFILLHLVDFTFGDKEGAPSIIAGVNNDESLGLFGLVWQSFMFKEHWWRPVFYVVAVGAVGLHISHGIQSMFQTIGLYHDKYTPLIIKVSLIVAVIVALGFITVPISVNIIGAPSL